MEIKLCTTLFSALHGGEWSISCSNHLHSEKLPVDAMLYGSRIILDVVAPQPLYSLSYHDLRSIIYLHELTCGTVYIQSLANILIL